MPTPTYIPLGTITLASTDSEIVFSSIPATYRDLVLVIQAEATANLDLFVRYNSDTTSSYSYVFMRDSLGTVLSSSGTTDRIYLGTRGLGTDQRGNYTMQIMDYSADKHKTTLERGMYRNIEVVRAFVSRWAKTEAINTIQIATTTSTLKVGSTFSLYGVN